VWTRLLAGLGATPAVDVEASVPGIVVVPTATPDGTRVLHVLNVSPWDAEVGLSRDGKPLGPGGATLLLPRRSGAWLVQPPGAASADLGFTGAEGTARWA